MIVAETHAAHNQTTNIHFSSIYLREDKTMDCVRAVVFGVFCRIRRFGYMFRGTLSGGKLYNNEKQYGGDGDYTLESHRDRGLTGRPLRTRVIAIPLHRILVNTGESGVGVGVGVGMSVCGSSNTMSWLRGRL